MDEGEWRIVEGANAAGGVSDRLFAPNRGDASGIFFDREIGSRVVDLLNFWQEAQRVKAAQDAEGGALR